MFSGTAWSKWRCNVAITHSGTMVRVFWEGRYAVQDNLHTGRPHVKNNTVQLLLACWMLIANGLSVSYQWKFEYVTKLYSTICTTFWVTANLQCIGYHMKFPRWNNGTAMQSHKPCWTGTKRRVATFLAELSLWTKPGPAHMNQTWNASQMEASWFSSSKESAPCTMCCEDDVHCGMWHWWCGNTASCCTSKVDGKRCLLTARSCSTNFVQRSGENDDTWWYRTPSFIMTMQGFIPLLLSWTSCAGGNERFWNIIVLIQYEEHHLTYPVWVHAITWFTQTWKVREIILSMVKVKSIPVGTKIRDFDIWCSKNYAIVNSVNALVVA